MVNDHCTVYVVDCPARGGIDPLFIIGPPCKVLAVKARLAIIRAVLDTVVVTCSTPPVADARVPVIVVATVIDGLLIIILPYLKIGQNWFHFVMPPIIPLLVVFLLVGVYFIMSEAVKLVYFRYWKPRNSVVS